KAIFISAFLLALIITSKAAIITMCIYFLWNIYNEPKGKSIFIAYISLAFLFLIILLLSWNYLSSTGLAEKVLYRFSGLIDFLSGTGGDNSSNERFEIYTSVFSFLANNID
ncbi:O32 family O-antigen polymerase, partial [Escherichia coli]